MEDKSKWPRGLRMNNPGNIEKTKPGKQKWQGEIESTDSRFAQFVDIRYGYRAMFKLLYNYITKLKKNTIEGMISTWAPPLNNEGKVENNTEAYIKTVSTNSKVDRKKVLTKDSAEDLIAIVAAMSGVENGRIAVIDDVRKGYEASKV